MRTSNHCDYFRLSGLGYETNKTCALKSIEQNPVNIPDIMIEMDTLTYQMQNNLQEFIFHQPLLSELINSVQIHSEFHSF